LGEGDLIRKIKIPRWIIIVATSISALINFAINLGVVAIFMFFADIELRWAIICLPLILLQIYLLALGLSLFLSAAYVRYRDLSHIWDVVTQAGFYITPILYPLQFIENPQFQKILLLNPLAQSIQDARYSLVSTEVLTMSTVFGNPYARLLPISLVLVILVFGVWYFKKESKHFAENL
jgi:ABC-2 type transport system permease protein